MTYSSTEVCEAAGITYRQLDYWTRTGLVPHTWTFSGSPGGSGNFRVFDQATLDMVVEAARPCSACGCNEVSRKLAGTQK